MTRRCLLIGVAEHRERELELPVVANDLEQLKHAFAAADYQVDVLGGRMAPVSSNAIISAVDSAHRKRAGGFSAGGLPVGAWISVRGCGLPDAVGRILSTTTHRTDDGAAGFSLGD